MAMQREKRRGSLQTGESPGSAGKMSVVGGSDGSLGTQSQMVGGDNDLTHAHLTPEKRCLLVNRIAIVIKKYAKEHLKTEQDAKLLARVKSDLRALREYAKAETKYDLDELTNKYWSDPETTDYYSVSYTDSEGKIRIESAKCVKV